MLPAKDNEHAAKHYRIRAIVAAAAVLTVIALVAPASAVAATVPQPAPGQVVGLSTTLSGTLSVFYESADRSLTEMSYAQGRWSSPQSLGGALTSGPAAISVGLEPETTYVYARGTDHAIWYRASTGGGPWSPWASLGGRATGAPTASSGVPTHHNLGPTVWVRGTDGALWQNSGAGWFSLGGRLTSDPAASPVVADNYPILGSAVIVALGTDHAVWAYFETDRPAGGSGWQRIGGRSTVAPAVGPGGSPAYARGTDNALWLTNWNAGATPPPAAAWHRVGGVLTSAPTATTYPSTAPYVVALGTDGNLWQGTPPASGTLWTWTQIP
jgi:hypothetical protein